MDKHVEVSFPSDKKIFGDIQIPGSKSISNRYLILKHFSGQNISFDNLSSSEDTVLLIKNLKAVSENLHKGATLYCHHAGTTFRFLLSLLCITPGEWILDGSERLRQRPHGALVDALNSLGAHIKSLHEDYRPPYLIEGNDNLKGGVIEARSDISSQVISSLLLVGPCLKGGLKIKTTGEKVSGGYIELTVQCMKKFGVEVIEHESCLIIPEQKYM
ncbi:MAG: 3-phosphoshikimate 1-carboxyvinyltransferase, partial [Bacteroidia bacterium]|nr:3-phosphoshikimate 1-carboxyvinyltransferase [Bacteroidia bacterium]